MTKSDNLKLFMHFKMISKLLDGGAFASYPIYKHNPMLQFTYVVKLGSRSKVYLKFLVRDLDLELEAIIAMPPPPPPPSKLF